jgi:iron complex transport system substrate-binding protein
LARLPAIRVVLPALAGLAFSIATAPAAIGVDTVEDGAGRSLAVSRTDGVDPDGETLTVEGRGFTVEKGIYVAFCVDNGPGRMPEPCGGGIDLTGETGASAWISSNPPPYGRELAVAYGHGGSFSVQIRVTGAIGEHDCTVERCAIVTRNDHTRTTDRSQDLVVPIRFDRFEPVPVATGAIAGVAVLTTLVVAWRRRSVTPAALLVGLVLSACAPTTSPAPSGASQPACGPTTADFDVGVVTPIATDPQPALPVTVHSADGIEVTIDDASRILPVNLYGSIAEIVFSLGLGDRVIGRDTSTTFAAAAHLPNVTGSGHALSAEAILDLDPSVVLTDASIGPPEAVAQLRASGVPVVLLDDQQTIENVSDQILTIATALGVTDAGERLVDRVESEIAEAATHRPTDTEPPTIAFLYIRGSAGVYLIGGDGAGPDAMIEGIGAVDAGSSIGLSGFRPITSEALIEAAPDVILMMTEGLASVGGVDGLLQQPGLAQTPAGEQRRVVDMDDGILLNFGARTGLAMAALADAVYSSCR